MHNPRDDFELTDRPATPEWFVTFADMMSLLLALFVMIASFSEVKEEEQFRAMSDSLRGQFGVALDNSQSASDAAHRRDPRLADNINSVRRRRASLLQIDLSIAIAGSADTTGTFATPGGDRPSPAPRQ